MRTVVIGAGALLLLAACNPNADTNNPAVATDEAVEERMAEAPAVGANSFTEDQARERLEAQGYTNPTGLMQGADGTWSGQATQNGQTVSVTVDYQGNVTTADSATPPPAAPQ
jgi:hypothetical protein